MKKPRLKAGAVNMSAANITLRVRNGQVRSYHDPGDVSVTWITDGNRKEPSGAPLVLRMGQVQEGLNELTEMPGMQPSDAPRIRPVSSRSRLSAGSDFRMRAVWKGHDSAVAADV
jgi:hypothetical protein